MSAGGWRVRRAGEGDVERLALVGAATFLETFADILDGSAVLAHCSRAHAISVYRGYLTQGAAAWLGETEGGAPVGYVLLTQPELDGALPGDLELKRIYLLSRFHGTGLGKVLMDAAIAEARARGAARLLLGVYRQNSRAIAFYRRSGFVDVGTRQFQVGEQLYDDVVLGRTL